MVHLMLLKYMFWYYFTARWRHEGGKIKMSMRFLKKLKKSYMKSWINETTMNTKLKSLSKNIFIILKNQEIIPYP